tara:strand:+ start:6005 stop:6352 length:348 start_codon:yes stop_codon:yes gene_type:complete
MTRVSVHRVEVSGDAGLRSAQALADQLREALAAHEAIAIVTEAVTSADITTIQLLLSARKQAAELHKSLSLAAPPTGVLRDLLIATGCLSIDGKPLTPDGDFWTPQADQAEENAA